ncbi:MAG: hypothetical protein WBM83_05110 [Flavobacteriaceae bacterium]
MWIEKFKGTIDIWINELDSYSIHQLSVKPNSKSWSLGQLYQHIIDETSWYHGQIEISLLDDAHASVPTTDVAAALFKAGSFADRRIQGDPLISENVKQPKSIDQIRSDLEKLKINTNKIWETISKTPSYGKSEHPGMGFLTSFEWLQYSEMHMRHHLMQKRRIDSFLNKHTVNTNK